MRKVRYAIYYSPKIKSPLWTFGAQWLGRTSKRLSVDGLSQKAIANMTEAPAHYGFHATLKPPFVLGKGVAFEDLDEALEKFAESCKPITIPALELAVLDDFLALRPKAGSKDLDDLAADCVKVFDKFRAPPTAKELGKRMQADLSKNQKKMLEKWGYPYVLDEFRFHMTLTERLEKKNRTETIAALSPILDKITGKDFTLHELTLFQQYSQKTSFEELKRYSFATS